MHVDFYFDLSCPYAYLGSEEIEALCARLGATLRWQPMLLGGVFRALERAGAGPATKASGDPKASSPISGEGPMATIPPSKKRHVERDARRWAARRGIPLSFPKAHPMRTVRALRVLLGLPEASRPAAIHALYRAYWRDNLDVTRDDVIEGALHAAGVDPAPGFATADSDAIKDELRRRTDEAVARGVFGAPAIFTGDVMLWGQDRLHWLEAVAEGWKPDEGKPPRVIASDRSNDGERSEPSGGSVPSEPGGGRGAPRGIDFWFDFSSPFAYLGSTQIEAVARAAGATVRWRPLLLGALFKQIGTPDVPLFAMPEAKRRYTMGELTRWANWWDVPFRMATRFPMRTVAALRLVLAADLAPALIHRLFRALWVEDADLADEATLRRLTAEVGLDPALVDRTQDAAIKQALIDHTAAARDAGVFGVPTCVVDGEVYWGQDRLDLVAAALRGFVLEG